MSMERKQRHKNKKESSDPSGVVAPEQRPWGRDSPILLHGHGACLK